MYTVLNAGQNHGDFPANPETRASALWWMEVGKDRCGQAHCFTKNALDRIGLPTSIHGSFQGTARAFQASLESQPMLIVAALLAVYIVLGMLYESYIHPITILSTLPSAGVGALLALLAFRTEFSIIALIGVILLIGIVKKNAIMMIDFALEAAATVRDCRREKAIYQACLLRFRPIMMTTMAALFGAMPLASAWAMARKCASRWASPLSADWS